jgi:hypothetical protein
LQMAEPGRVEFARDSPLEEAGFEPSVPPVAKGDFVFGEREAGKGHVDDKGRSRDGEYPQRDRWFESISLQR